MSRSFSPQAADISLWTFFLFLLSDDDPQSSESSPTASCFLPTIGGSEELIDFSSFLGFQSELRQKPAQRCLPIPASLPLAQTHQMSNHMVHGRSWSLPSCALPCWRASGFLHVFLITDSRWWDLMSAFSEKNRTCAVTSTSTSSFFILPLQVRTTSVFILNKCFPLQSESRMCAAPAVSVSMTPRRGPVAEPVEGTSGRTSRRNQF